MKMKYVKPTILVERFSLTQSIASGCQGVTGGMAFEAVGPTQWGPTTCTWNAGGVELFILDANCYMGPAHGESFEFQGYCYNNPTEGYAMFSS